MFRIREESARTIQKYLTGFTARSKVLPQLMLTRFNANMDFFTEKRRLLLTDFQIKLKRVWFAYKHRKNRLAFLKE